MKIFVSYSSKDSGDVEKIVTQLERAGYFVCNASHEFLGAPNLATVINQGLDEADIVLAFITDSYNNSSYASVEFSAVSLRLPKRLLAIVIGDAKIPSFMSGILYKRYDDFVSSIAEDIIFLLNNIDSEKKIHSVVSEQEIKLENENKYINDLKNALHNNRLTLVCGAGISISAGIPSWNTLLLSMLNKCVNTQYQFNVESAQNALPTSNIILGKYLKLMLGNEFESTLKECLYDQLGEDQTYYGKKVYKETPLIHELINLLRPKRNSGSVESVITFNFDSLIEDTLDKYGIENQAIYDEGMIVDSRYIPIYHVHGYLPQTGEIKAPNIVFSEEAYHTQFIDPYSWSNLVQLYKYMENTCLLLGLSITDPNLRRLLDISKRKNSSTKLRHYIIKKKPDISDDFMKTQMLLEEQDANSLGLNVFWIDDFEEIPNILDRIGK
ncbi:MAG: TIR domain-containing protein [Lachnospiraceae bacterium]|nr:TIR domain-containing protein [Lachnospiraceae bacterium]